MMDINLELLQWPITFSIRILLVEQLIMKLHQIKNLAEELHKPIIRKFEKRKVDALFIGNIWGADLADMRLINKFIKCILHM